MTHHKRNVVILGAGVAGLAAGWMFARTGKYKVTLVERAPYIGGVCATFKHDRFLLDHGPHKCYSAIDGIMDELRALMGDELLTHEKSNSIYLFNSFLKYPISIAELARKMGLRNLVNVARDACVATLRSNGKADSYEAYAVAKFGRSMYELVFGPLAEKIWGDPRTLSADIARTRIPSSSLIDIALRASGLRSQTELTDAKYFYYPKKGFGRIGDRMAEEIHKASGVILTSTPPVKIHSRSKTVTGVEIERNGRQELLPCDLLVSSIPLDHLVRMLSEGSDVRLSDALTAAQTLQYRTCFLVYVFVEASRLTNHHWMFFPESEFIFGRVFEQKRMSPAMAPLDQTVLCCDFTDFADGPLAQQTDDALAQRCIVDLERIGLLDRRQVVGTLVKRLPKFYPRYDLNYRHVTSTLYESLKQFDNLYSTGRIGFYNYNNSDHCVDMARFLVDRIENNVQASQVWSELEARVQAYRIVD